ncbi:hypothetical protein [Paractinoplanes maris]|uniref:hypothetical protein n=1 Tax=Paractinoplanes maris TaxID=1734446 RepID=UPI00202022F1|nr:hypothetical protein [Actinoplanes maris]
MSGFLICYLCELAGRGPGERFKVPADGPGQARMERHVLEPHPATDLAGVRVPDTRPIDLDLDGGEGGSR